MTRSLQDNFIKTRTSFDKYSGSILSENTYYYNSDSITEKREIIRTAIKEDVCLQSEIILFTEGIDDWNTKERGGILIKNGDYLELKDFTVTIDPTRSATFIGILTFGKILKTNLSSLDVWAWVHTHAGQNPVIPSDNKDYPGPFNDMGVSKIMPGQMLIFGSNPFSNYGIWD